MINPQSEQEKPILQQRQLLLQVNMCSLTNTDPSTDERSTVSEKKVKQQTVSQIIVCYGK